MADLTVTAVRITDTTQFARVTYGATISAGQVVYVDTADSECKLADCDNSQATAKVKGIAITPGVDGGSGLVATGGNLILVGASMTVGDGQVLSGTAGAIQQDADLATGDWVTQIGRAVTSTEIKLQIQPLDVQVP